MSRTRHWLRSSRAGMIGVALGTAVTMSTAGAGAAPPDPVILARTQFQQGLALETAGDWAGALSLFQLVAAVRLTPQVRFNIALCEERLGRLAAALGDYRIAASEADAAKAADVAALVAAHSEELRARIPKLIIHRAAGGEYANVSLDGISLGSASVGSELPVDPGPHTVTAKAPGYKPFSASFDVSEKETKTVDLVLERVPVVVEPPDQGPSSTRPSGSKGEEPPHKPNRVLPIVIGSVGVASLITSGIFFGLRAGAIKDLDNGCGGSRDTCPTDLQSTYDQGKTYNTVADVTLAVGVVGVVTGTVLFLTQKKQHAAPASMGFVPAAPGAEAGASFFAKF